MGYRGQITFDQLQAAGKGFVTDVRVFLQELLPNGRSGPRVVEVRGFDSVAISRGINTKGTATVQFSNPNDRVFRRGFNTDQTKRHYSKKNGELTRLAITQTLLKSLPYVTEINPERQGPKFQDGFTSLVPAHTRIQTYLDTVYNFTATQPVAAKRPRSKRHDSRFVDLVSFGLMQRVFIDLVGQDGLVYAGFTGIVSSVSDDFTAGQMPMVTIQCSDYWRLLELTEIIVKQGPGVENPAEGGPDIRDTVVFNTQHKLGIKADDYKTSPFDNQPGQRILLDVLRITQGTLCFVPNVLERVEAANIASALNAATTKLFDPASSETISTTRQSVEIKADDTAMNAREEYFFDDPFWTLPTPHELKATYDGHTNLRRVSPGARLISATDEDGDPKTSEGVALDKLLYDNPGRKVGEGIKHGDRVAFLTGTYQIDKFIETGTQSIVYQQLIKNILGPWQAQYATGTAILKKLADATFFDLFFTGNGDLIYQIPKYNNFPGEHSVIQKEVIRPLTSAVADTKEDTADAKANPEDGGDPRLNALDILEKDASKINASVDDQQRLLNEDRESGKITLAEYALIRAQIEINKLKAASLLDRAEKLEQDIKASNESRRQIVSDYGGLKKAGVYDYSPDPRYPSKYHGYNYVITDLGLRKWGLLMSEEPVISVMRVPGGTNLIGLDDVLQGGFSLGRTSLEKTLALQRRFGIRARTTQQIFIPDLYSSFPDAKPLLDAFAEGLLQQVNGLRDSGSINLTIRPDLELGRNINLVERQKLYYIDTINTQWVIASDNVTALGLTHGHDWHEELPNPWAAATLNQVRASPPPREPTPPQPTVERGIPETTTRIVPGPDGIWSGFVWPMPTLSYRGGPFYADPKIAGGSWARRPTAKQRLDGEEGSFHLGADILYQRKPDYLMGGVTVVAEAGVTNNGNERLYCPNGVPVYACGTGNIIAIRYSRALGWLIKIDHEEVAGWDPGDGNNRLVSFYQHMTYYDAAHDPLTGLSAGSSDVGPTKFFTEAHPTGLNIGTRVEAGEQIGFVGRGPQLDNPAKKNSTLVHLHFELFTYNSKENPRTLTRGQEGNNIDPKQLLIGKKWGHVVSDVNLEGDQYRTEAGELLGQ